MQKPINKKLFITGAGVSASSGIPTGEMMVFGQ